MSTFSQKKYIEHLKLIKEAEDKVQTEIEAHRKLVEEEINHLQEELFSCGLIYRYYLLIKSWLIKITIIMIISD